MNESTILGVVKASIVEQKRSRQRETHGLKPYPLRAAHTMTVRVTDHRITAPAHRRLYSCRLRRVSALCWITTVIVTVSSRVPMQVRDVWCLRRENEWSPQPCRPDRGCR